jgi:outer membrane immunogenic protein
MRVSPRLATALAIGVSTAAYADGYGPGYAPRYYPTWTGFYVGVNGGYGFDDKSGTITFTNALPQVFTAARSIDASGGFGGGQIGYNWQSGQLVLGIEADFQGADMRGTFSNSTVTGFADIWAGRREVNSFGTVRGRLGYSFGQVLLYGTGGFAYGDVREKLVRTGPAGAEAVSVSDDSVRTGFVVGGGLEYALSPAWSAKVEYQFFDLGRERLFGSYASGLGIHTNELDNTFGTVRVGLNYKFGTDRYVPVPLK